MLTRFLGSSTPVIYWISGHFLLSCEPLLKEDKNLAYGKRQNTLERNSNFSIMCINNPITQLLVRWRTCSFPTQCILGYFISYWLLGLALHCNFLPWTWHSRYGWTVSSIVSHISAFAESCLMFGDCHDGLINKFILKHWLSYKKVSFLS